MVSAAAPAMSRQCRRWLLQVADACGRGTGRFGEAAVDVVEELSVRAPAVGARVSVEAADRDALAGEEDRLRLLYERMLAHQQRASMHGATFVLCHHAVDTRRWTVDGAEAFALARRHGLERFVAWQLVVERLALPGTVHVRWRPGAGGSGVPGQLLAADSPLAVAMLFDGLPPALDRLIITAAPA